MTHAQIYKVPLFASLSPQSAFDLLEKIDARSVPAGSRLFRYGDAADAVFFVLSGRVRIHLQDYEGNDTTLAEFGEGQFFGEMAILNSRPRSADATAITDVHLGVMSAGDFLWFIDRNPHVATRMLTAIADRLHGTDHLCRTRVSRNLNQEIAASTSRLESATDRIAAFAGSWRCVLLSLGCVAGWMALNSRLPQGSSFDPYPYNLLNLILKVLPLFQGPLIMMSQNRQKQKERLRADLDYRVNLNNELSLAEILRRLEPMNRNSVEISREFRS